MVELRRQDIPADIIRRRNNDNALAFGRVYCCTLDVFCQLQYLTFYFRINHFSRQVKNAHRVDLTATLKGLTIHCKEESPDMYASIDAVSTALQSKLSKYRQRRNDGYHAGNRMGDDLMEALAQAEFEEVEVVESDDFVDPEEPNVMKVSSYDIDNAIPIKEAIFALDYVDHDFFVFKNEETGKKSVVYKRNAGGIGLIEL